MVQAIETNSQNKHRNTVLRLPNKLPEPTHNQLSLLHPTAIRIS